jgi:UDP-glucose 4-epimerase
MPIIQENFFPHFYQGQRILVTGSSGYLANNLINALKDINCHITRLSRTGEILSLINGQCEITDIITDIEDEKIWQQILPTIDIIFHFAAQTNIQKANECPIEDRNSNVLPLLSLLETCRKKNHHPIIILASTVCIVGNVQDLPINEAVIDNPPTMYELHKLQCEQYLKYYISKNYVKGAALRLSNVYGPGVKDAMTERGFLNTMIRRAITSEPITIHGEGDFYRDYIYIDDVSTAFLTAASQIDKINGQHVIVAHGASTTIKTVAEMVAEQVGNYLHKPIQITYIPFPENASPMDKRQFQADIRLFSSITGWQPTVSLEKGISLTLQAML